MEIREGRMPYLGYETYYRVAGHAAGNKKPLVLLHGGPGSTHNYFEVLDALAEKDGRQLVMYDQLGCGQSWVDADGLWNMDTWLGELAALREHLGLKEIHLLGQSWGGMLLLEYVCRHRPEGVKSIILSSTLPSSRMWGEEQHRMIQFLPQEMREAIAKAEASGDYTGEDYQAAEAEYMLRHAGGPALPDGPECLLRPARKGRAAYVEAWGPNEFTPAGNLRDFDVTELLPNLQQPALVISGGSDLCTPYVAKYMYDHIPNARWELFRNCRHMCFVEDTAKYIALLREWMNAND